MESSGKTGHINVSERTKYWLEKEYPGVYRYEPHENVFVKSLNFQIQSYLIYAREYDEMMSLSNSQSVRIPGLQQEKPSVLTLHDGQRFLNQPVQNGEQNDDQKDKDKMLLGKGGANQLEQVDQSEILPNVGDEKLGNRNESHNQH
mgnify:CR=1 FL=1